MVNKKVTIANSVNIDLLSFLLSASPKDIKLYKVIFITLYFGMCDIYNVIFKALKRGQGTRTIKE